MLLVFSNPSEGQDEEFNRWYDEKHVVDVLAIPGITSGQRFALHQHDDPLGAPAPKHRYVAAYSLEVEPETVMKEFSTRLSTGELDVSPALDVRSVSMTFWSPLGSPRTS